MPECKHESPEYVGEQKTDDGVNVYRRCKSCGVFLVIAPSGKVIGVRGRGSLQPAAAKREGKL